MTKATHLVNDLPDAAAKVPYTFSERFILFYLRPSDFSASVINFNLSCNLLLFPLKRIFYNKFYGYVNFNLIFSVKSSKKIDSLLYE